MPTSTAPEAKSRTIKSDPAAGTPVGSKGETTGTPAAKAPGDDVNGRKVNADLAGHAAHTKDAASLGLPGEMPRPIKIAFMGAGSGFCPTLVKDVLCVPGATRGEIALCDVDAGRLGTMKKVIQKLVEASGRTGWKVSADTDRRKLLKGSHYVVNSIEVSGLACVRHDNDIPKKYGVDQCIGDTLGPGGLMKSLRTGPVFLDIVRDVRELCPDAVVLNYTNPMSALCLAAGRSIPEVSVVGLCHSVQGTGHLLADRAGVPYEELSWECAGVNHLAWFTTLEHAGKSLYPKLMRMARADLDKTLEEGFTMPTGGDPRTHERAEHHHDVVRKDMMLHFGAFITESSGHLSEYLPYYRKRPDLIAAYARPGYDGGSSFYADHWPEWRQTADDKRDGMVSGREPLPELKRSWEYAAWIIEGREKDQPVRIHGNVMNVPRPGSPLAGSGPLIANLPHDACVEVACYVDRTGVRPGVYGKLPPQMAALCASQTSYFDLVADAIVNKDKQAATYALLLDPLTAAVCSPAEIERMAAELFDAEADFLPGYK